MRVTTQKLSELWNLQHVLQGPDSLEMGGTAFGTGSRRQPAAFPNAVPPISKDLLSVLLPLCHHFAAVCASTLAGAFTTIIWYRRKVPILLIQPCKRSGDKRPQVRMGAAGGSCTRERAACARPAAAARLQPYTIPVSTEFFQTTKTG